jgi:hypothetical protein
MTIIDIDAVVAQADPARAVASPTGTSATAQWTYVQITRPDEAVSRLRVPRRLTVPIAAVVGVIVIVTTGGVLVSVGGRAPSPTVPHTSAVAVFERAAVAAAAAPPSQPGPGQYQYTETKSLEQLSLYQQPADAGAGASAAMVANVQYPETEQSWADINGDGDGVLTRGSLQFPSAADASAWNASAPGRQFASHFSHTVQEPALQQSAANVTGLSTNPQVLAQQIAQRSNGATVDPIADGPSAVFQRAANLLVGPDVGMTPALAGALYDVLANQPGTMLLGTTTDHSGRQGVAISISSATGVSEIIIDPHSGAALEIQFSPPALTGPSATGGATVTCETNALCDPSTARLAPQGFVWVQSTLWTDTVSTAIVNSSTSTQPASESSTK